MTMQEATKRPWTFKEAKNPSGSERSMDCAICDPDGEIIAECFQFVGRTSEGQLLERPRNENAALIVRAVNSFDQAHAALEWLLNLLHGVSKHAGSGFHHGVTDEEWQEAITQAKAALAAMKGA